MKNLNRKNLILVAGAIAVILLMLGTLSCENQKDTKPNIIYILTDDLGYGDIGYLNKECIIPTPNIDKLGEQGMAFTDAHSGSAVCTPTRYGILTGRYSWRSRLQSGVTGGYSKALIDSTRLTVTSLLKEQGYATACIGKWHLGWDWGLKDTVNEAAVASLKYEHVDFNKKITNGPTDVGFDYFFGIPASLDMSPYVYVENDYVVEPPTKIIKGAKNYELYRAGPSAENFKHEEVLPTFTKKVIDYINQYGKSGKTKPFFLYFALNAPHTPILPSPEFKGKTGYGPYADFVNQCDWVVGQVMKTLEENGLSDNTLVIFTSDNGFAPMANNTHLEELGHYPSYEFRGYKADIFEGGHRIPFIARWPGKILAGSTSDDIIGLTDLVATVADIVETKLPDNLGEDSESLLPVLTGVAKKPVHEAIIHHSVYGLFSIRQGKWKLNLCPGSGGWAYPRDEKAVTLGLPKVQLYDLSKDIGEQVNLQAQYPEVVHRLTNLLEDYVANGRSVPGKTQQNDADIDIWKSLKLRTEKTKL